MDSINITLFGEILTFIVLVWVTMKYVWPPIMNALNERQQKIANGLAAAERGQHDLEISQQKALQIVQEARIGAATIMEQTQQKAAELIEHSKAKAREEGERLLALAHSNIEQEKIAARQQLQQQVAILAVMIAEKLIRTNLNVAANQQLIEQLIKEL